MAEEKAWVLWCWPAEDGPQIKAVFLREDGARAGIDLLNAVSDVDWRMADVPMVGSIPDAPASLDRSLRLKTALAAALSHRDLGGNPPDGGGPEFDEAWRIWSAARADGFTVRAFMTHMMAALKAAGLKAETTQRANDRRIHAGRVDGVRRARDAIEDYQSECALEAGSGGAAWQAKYDALGTALVQLDVLLEDWKETGGPVEGESVAMGDAAADPLAVPATAARNLADKTAPAMVMINDGDLPPVLPAGTPVAPAMEMDGKIRLPSDGKYRLPNGCTIHGSYNQEAPLGTLRVLATGNLKVITAGRYHIGFGTDVKVHSPGDTIAVGSRWVGLVYEDAAAETKPDASHAKPVWDLEKYHQAVCAELEAQREKFTRAECVSVLENHTLTCRGAIVGLSQAIRAVAELWLRVQQPPA